MKTRDGRTPSGTVDERPDPKSARTARAAETSPAPAAEGPGHSFDSIDGSRAYVDGLLQVVEETASGVGQDLRNPGEGGRRREALQVVAWKLEQLRFHLAASRRRLGDLAALRLLLEGDRSAA